MAPADMLESLGPVGRSLMDLHGGPNLKPHEADDPLRWVAA